MDVATMAQLLAGATNGWTASIQRLGNGADVATMAASGATR